MSFMDFKDRLDTEQALKLARSHGNSDSFMAFIDRMNANHLVEQYNRTQAALNRYRERMGDPTEELLGYC
ncbi:MAG: hypothetical protein AABX71_01575 [Nanoarchaeota archaeon]